MSYRFYFLHYGLQCSFLEVIQFRARFQVSRTSRSQAPGLGKVWKQWHSLNKVAEQPSGMESVTLTLFSPVSSSVVFDRQLSGFIPSLTFLKGPRALLHIFRQN